MGTLLHTCTKHNTFTASSHGCFFFFLSFCKDKRRWESEKMFSFWEESDSRQKDSENKWEVGEMSVRKPEKRLKTIWAVWRRRRGSGVWRVSCVFTHENTVWAKSGGKNSQWAGTIFLQSKLTCKASGRVVRTFPWFKSYPSGRSKSGIFLSSPKTDRVDFSS